MNKTLISMLVCGFAVSMAFGDWPVLRTYEGECLRRVRMPMGGIGTGTVSLSGRGSLVDWETLNRPAKGRIPSSGNWAPHFAIRCETADGRKVARLLEGPLLPEEYEGDTGCPVRNQGFPRFESAVFKAAYPLVQIELADRAVPLSVRLEAMNPLVPGDASASGIPAVLFRWRVANPGKDPVGVSVAGTVIVPEDGTNEIVLAVADGVGSVSAADEIREDGWNVSLDRYWRRFLADGTVGNSPANEPKRLPVRQTSVAFELAPGEAKPVPFVLAWRSPERWAWPGRKASTNRADVVGNFYATEYPSAARAARRLLDGLPELEAKTVAFVEGVLASDAPDVVKEAALFNLSTLRTETCFRTADGHFYAWEGCFDDRGSCYGSCTHVWGYEHALVDLWPALARDMLELQFGTVMHPISGRIAARVLLPLSRWEGFRAKDKELAAADGQMQCIVKAYEYWFRTDDDGWMRTWYPSVRTALAFCWRKGGWDADEDGVMDGCQHNTMDVEYYGPNPQMQFLYLAALEAVSRMAEAADDAATATKCRGLCEAGRKWTEANLFNGSYYEHLIRPPKDAAAVAPGLRHETMGAKDPTDPDYQLGKGCLIDQLLGDYAARIAGLGPVADEAHARTALATVVRKCRKAPDDDAFNPMRGFAMRGEESIRMAWYPEGTMPRSPFPYYTETMTGFEYVVAALQALYGDRAGAERTVRNIRARYDGAKRNPFDEAECGHHYARALAAWSVYRAFAAGK